MTKTAMNRCLNFLRLHPITALALCGLGILGIHATTLAEYPAAWFDEIEILEMGRFSIFDVNPSWSVNMFPLSTGDWVPPSPLFHYLASFVLEALYRLTGSFLLGRFCMLLSLPCCALALFTWLRARQFSPLISLMVALLLLIDPNATICAHWYRPDLWCMTLTFSALTLLENPGKRTWRGILAGALMAVSLFFWITSALFLPLVLLSVLQLESPTQERPTLSSRCTRLLAVALGGIISTAILLIPLYPHISAIIAQYLNHSEIASLGQIPESFTAKLASNVFDFIKIAIRSPFIWLMAVLGIATMRRPLHAALFVALSAFMICTRVYHLRMVYLMPFIFLFAAEAVQKASSFRPRWKKVCMTALLLPFGWGVGISILALNYAAWPEANTLKAFTNQLSSAITMAHPKVYLYDFEHETYYAGRKLGWQMYSYNQRDLIFSEPNAGNLDHLDAVVTSSMLPPLTDEQISTLKQHGFTHKKSITTPPAATGALKSRLALLFYAHGYPNYEVWKKTSSLKQSVPETTKRL